MYWVLLAKELFWMTAPPTGFTNHGWPPEPLKLIALKPLSTRSKVLPRISRPVTGPVLPAPLAMSTLVPSGNTLSRMW